ncbi:hypothetical protein VOLCADRAFT_108193 [Volvox carteri f. nagariensis]|uniref:BACK domain-containing protein n=1 Tax=Volvox carteri f. nagariensis TaxID=3068 RepID=D8UIU5_VOLCA|nr:uncharacterized protein VOLCADRAFT_108193 [Volvox carteri f. nagariensis]EFJ40317.1 hypothetical protein VOLCADRAFT_108193 [Volvox carteri f. nagariensis]|eukprot:XP_002958580.1 hypothetical protein VOLCADRAFT_108193 [Volvox carteri f. nagariensis]
MPARHAASDVALVPVVTVVEEVSNPSRGHSGPQGPIVRDSPSGDPLQDCGSLRAQLSDATRIGGFPPEPEPLTPLELGALQAALQEAAAATAFPHGGEPTQEGVAAVEQLAQQALEGIDLSRPVEGGPGAIGLAPWPDAANGGSGEEGISVELLVRAGPERVSALSTALACLLRRTLSPRNCFAVLLLGRRLGCSVLAEEALLACIASFPAAVRADKRHFLMLDDSSLLLITSNSNLQVFQELDVWQAISEWVQHSWESRRGHLYDLLQAGVRLSHLDTLQLSQLQRHPLLLAEPGPAAQLGTPPPPPAAAAANTTSTVKLEPWGCNALGPVAKTGSEASGGFGTSHQVQQRQPRQASPGPLPGVQAHSEAGAGGGNADKRQLASMLAQAIAKAAAKQGLPRIQLGAGGQVTPGAVQAALSAAQKQMAANPQLQEMLREAKAQMAQSSAPSAIGSTASASSPSPLAISPGLASQLLLAPGSHASNLAGQQLEPGRPPPLQQHMALAPQQLLQIAAAVQKAVRSGQPQPPHVRQQLQQLQAFISRQLAATPAGSPQQPLLLSLQSMLAGAGPGTVSSPQPGAQQLQAGELRQNAADAGRLPEQQQRQEHEALAVAHAEGKAGQWQGQDVAQWQGVAGETEEVAAPPGGAGGQLGKPGGPRLLDGGAGTEVRLRVGEEEVGEPDSKRRRHE